MEREKILDKIVEICKDIFEDDTLALTEDTSSTDISGWDSFAHLNIIDDIENEFQIHFTLEEITMSKNIGALITASVRHLGEKKK